MNEDPERGSKKYYLIVAALLLLILGLFALIYGRPVIQNDGISYYGLTLSLVADGDFNLHNQHQKHREIRVIPIPGSDKVASYYSCGIAFLYAPFLYLMDLSTALREWRPYAQNVRFPFSHSFGIFAGSLFYSFLSVFLSYVLLTGRQKLSPVIAFLICLFCFVGTPLMFYTVTVPSFAHASDTFLVTAAFILAVSGNYLEFRSIRFRNVILGFVLALSMMLRNNNIVIVPFLVLGVLYLEWEKGWNNAIRTCLEILAGALPVLAVHMHFNLSQYGKLVATGYTVEVSQHVEARLYRFHWIFFHPVSGIYPWSPIALLGTIGLIAGAWKKNRAAIVALTIVVVVIVSIRFAAVIFPGATFGQRLVTHLYVFWVYGVAEICVRYRKITMAIATLCMVWTFLLFHLYYALTGCRESRIMTREGGASAIEWVQTSLECYRETGSDPEPISFMNKNLSAKPYPALYRILRDLNSTN